MFFFFHLSSEDPPRFLGLFEFSEEVFDFPSQDFHVLVKLSRIGRFGDFDLLLKILDCLTSDWLLGVV
jgi:hypothetical protein